MEPKERKKEEYKTRRDAKSRKKATAIITIYICNIKRKRHMY